MLGNNEKRNYLHISEGKVIRKTDQGRTERYDYVEGTLERIYQGDRNFRGERVSYWYLDLRDTQTGELYTLGINATSGVWRGIILSLGTCTNLLLPVRIAPYKTGNYNRVSVYSGGKKLEWVSDLPPVEEIVVEGQRIKSVQKREEFMYRIVNRINNTLQK